MDAQWEEAKEQITLMQKWFENSRWGKLYCQNVKGTWFVEQAHKHIEDFTHDRVMEEDIRISYALQDGDSQMIRDLKKRRELWREERNRWREEMCLEGVDDAVH